MVKIDLEFVRSKTCLVCTIVCADVCSVRREHRRPGKEYGHKNEVYYKG